MAERAMNGRTAGQTGGHVEEGRQQLVYLLVNPSSCPLKFVPASHESEGSDHLAGESAPTPASSVDFSLSTKSIQQL